MRYILGVLLLIPLFPAHGQEMCTYSTYSWNIAQREAVNHSTVSKPYSELQPYEIDLTTGCTLCQEDQATVQLPGIKPFMLCKRFAKDVGSALEWAMEQNITIHSISGYRVGKTRGDADSNGNRTQYSNHSFGIALDINENQNGLYENCIEFSPACKLRKGGPWRPGTAGTLTSDSLIVRLMKEIGLKWGGEIQGKQKDFMHFSPSGY